MSDEQLPPQLRLRPRKRDDEVSPAAVAPALNGLDSPSETETPQSSVAAGIEVQEQPAPAIEIGTMRFRLKPKLSAEPVGLKTEIALSEPVSISSAVAADVSPSGVSATPEIPRLKLRSLATPGSVGMEPPPMIPVNAFPAMPQIPAIPGFPVMQPITDVAMIGGLLPIPVTDDSVSSLPSLPLTMSPGAKSAPPVSAATPYVKKPQAKRVNSRVVLLALVGVLVLAGAGVYFFLMGAEQPAPPVVVKPAQPAPVVVAQPTPVPPELEIAPLPPQPSSFQVAADAAKLAPKLPVAPVVTPAFRTWVDQARISGVVVGESPRAIINGRLARPGDMVDAAEGIVFDAMDTESKTLMFRSRVNAFLEKSY